MKRVSCLFLLASLALPVASIAAQTQRGQIRSIPLTKDAKQNGYSLTGEGVRMMFAARGVEDPVLKKPLEGSKTLEYRCREPESAPLRRALDFSAGNSGRVRLGCPLLIEPKILLLEED